jgi:hypothetical protein
MSDNEMQPQEWTPQFVHDLVTKAELPYQAVADAHNAALAAVQERVSQAWLKAESDTIRQLRDQLAAEREKVKLLVDALVRAKEVIRDWQLGKVWLSW